MAKKRQEDPKLYCSWCNLRIATKEVYVKAGAIDLHRLCYAAFIKAERTIQSLITSPDTAA